MRIKPSKEDLIYIKAREALIPGAIARANRAVYRFNYRSSFDYNNAWNRRFFYEMDLAAYQAGITDLEPVKPEETKLTGKTTARRKRNERNNTRKS